MARDKIHDVVRVALENDGWIVTKDPLVLRPFEKRIEIDIAAEKVIIAEKGTEKIAVEVKSFTAPSVMYSFHQAVGQYFNYLIALEETEEDRVLYLAITEDTYAVFLQNSFITVLLKRHGIKLIITDVENKKIKQWIK